MSHASEFFLLDAGTVGHARHNGLTVRLLLENLLNLLANSLGHLFGVAVARQIFGLDACRRHILDGSHQSICHIIKIASSKPPDHLCSTPKRPYWIGDSFPGNVWSRTMDGFKLEGSSAGISSRIGREDNSPYSDASWSGLGYCSGRYQYFRPRPPQGHSRYPHVDSSRQ